MLLATFALLPTIWIVDAANGPGTHFTDLPAAVAAAQSGDTILVRAGSYSAFEVVGKALTIRGAGQLSTVVDQAGPLAAFVRIGPAANGGAVALAGMSLRPPAPASGNSPGLRVELDAVAVLTDCTVKGPDWTGSTVMLIEADGAQVAGRLHASRCVFSGGSSPNAPAMAGDGVAVETGGAFAGDACLCAGGSVGNIFLGPVLGGQGLLVDGGRATLHDSSCAGGNAGFSQVTATSFPGDGVRVQNGGFARLAGNSACTGGTSAPFTFAYQPAGVRADAASAATMHAPAQAIPGGATGVAIAGSVTTGGLELPRITLSGTVTPADELLATQPVTVAVSSSLPNAPMVLFADVDTNYSTFLAPFVLGEVLVPLGTPAQYFLLDGSGDWQLSFTPAIATPLALGMPVFLQAGVFDWTQIRASQAASRIFAN